MLRSAFAVVLLRVLLVLAALWLAVILVFAMPGELADEALAFRIPAQVVLSIGILCVMAVLVCIWRLLTLIARDRLFSDASRRWVDVIVWALALGWGLFALSAMVLVGFVFFSPERDPGLPMLLSGAVVLSALPLLLMVVMRGLLRQATGYRAELDEVI